MSGRPPIAKHAFLLPCASMCLGTGASLVLFSLAVAPQLATNDDDLARDARRIR